MDGSLLSYALAWLSGALIGFGACAVAMRDRAARELALERKRLWSELRLSTPSDRPLGGVVAHRVGGCVVEADAAVRERRAAVREPGTL